MEEFLAHELTIESITQKGLLILIIYAILEMAYLYFFKKYEGMKDYKQTTINFLFVIGMNIVVGALIGVISTASFSLLAFKNALFTTDLTYYWWIYGFLIYELFYWIQHWLAHKVRLIWCLHSPHHAPESMNMLVGFNHSFIEVIFYMPFFLGFMPSLLGVHPVIVLSIAVIDIIWGNLLHINEKVVPSGRYGLLEKILQTPSHHRVHHAQNVMYLDTNYNSMTLFWDWALGTLQPLREDEKVKYGITRNVKSDNFWDVQFGEFVLLAKDMWNASGILNKLNYLFQPPGWSHTRKHTGLVSELKKELKKD